MGLKPQQANEESFSFSKMTNRTFSAYSDESGIFDQRYQAIGVISGPDDELIRLRTRLEDILSKENVNELRFVNIRRSPSKILTATQHFFICAIKEFAIQKRLRIDVIIWEDQTLSNNIQARHLKLEDMYHKILTHMGRQWKQIDWNFYPDENSQINWDQIAAFLNRTSLIRRKPRLLQLFESYDAPLSFHLSNIKQLQSICEPIIQLADLFAGMARLSREEGEQCIQWLDSWGNKAQGRFPKLFDNADNENDASRARRARFELIGKFDKLCKRYRLYVSLRTNKCLWTYDPVYPINFWNC